MTTLGTKQQGRGGLSAAEAMQAAEAVMRTDLGQQALRQSWGRGLFEFVKKWGKPPTETRTIEKLKRAANDLRWELIELEKKPDKTELDKANLKLLQSAASVEVELREEFLEPEIGDS